MVVVHYKPQQLWDWLDDHGCEVYECSDETLDHKVIIYISPAGKTVPIQIKEAYYAFYVCRVCEALEIDIPNRFVRYKEQLDELRRIKGLEKLPPKEGDHHSGKS